MNYSFETQGPVTYLVVEVEPKEVIDTLTMGMLSNNHIVGFAPVLYTELDGRRFLKYNISAKLTANQFFSGNITPARALEGFKNILTAICTADDYMIDTSCFDFNADHIFINISSCEVAMICAPIIKTQDVNTEVINLFRLLLNSSGLFDSPELAKIKNYIEASDSFNIYNLKNIVDCWTPGVAAPFQSTPQRPVQTPDPITAQPNKSGPAKANGNSYVPPVLNNGASNAATPKEELNFNGTISMEQAPKLFNKTSIGGAEKKDIPPANEPFKFNPPPKNPPIQNQPHFGGVPYAPQINTGKSPERKVYSPNGAGAANNNNSGKMKPPFGAVPPVPNGRPTPSGQQGMAIPGKPPMPNKPPMPGNSAQNTEKKKESSFFKKLFGHNKGNTPKNAEKKHKKDKKNKYNNAIPQQPPIPNMSGANPPMPNGMMNNPGFPPMNNVPNNNGMMQGYNNQFNQARPAVINAAPINNSFNETTVLSPIGETTVLGGVADMSGPHLTRMRTGEKISINKPVFRIGKESSYVDYFIRDNTAISRSHANIITSGDEYFVEDTNSTNHTYVNGKMINANEKIKLSSGDVVRLANEDFSFSV